MLGKKIRLSSLTGPVDIASLAAFRILFGLLMAAAMVRFLAKGWVRQLYVEPVFYFTYPGFEWVRPWPEALMHAHFIVLTLLALGVAAGYYYRICVLLFFVGFTYVELIDQTTYLNHYYLISLVSGLMIFLPAHRAWSLDARRRPGLRLQFVPAWTLNILRLQVGVVYFFAGLAKLNSDWLLGAQPLRTWLAARSDLPFMGSLLNEVWVAYAACWFGALFDLGIVFLLLWSRTRLLAFALVVIFHVVTGVLFNIGMFPWIMIVAAMLLFPSDWPRRFLNRFRSRRQAIDLMLKTPIEAVSPFRTAKHGLLLAAVGTYSMAQLVLPLRPYLSAQPAAWTCSGFNCAWQVMIAEKTGFVEFYACDPATGRRWKLSLRRYITPRQEGMMAQDPYLIREMARRLADDLRAEGMEGVQIKVDAYAAMNGHPSQRIIDPEVDLAGPARPGWILPLAE